MAELAATPELLYLHPTELEPWPGLNPRTHFSEERIREIAASIADHGVLQNLVVTEVPGEARYWIVAGETRWRAAQLAAAGCPEIGLEPTEVRLPCRAVPLVEGEALALAMLENLQRQSLTAVEEARGFQRLLDLNRWTQARLAEEMLGDAKRQPYVANRLRLLELPATVLDLIQEGHVQHSQARDYILPLLQLEDNQPQLALERVVARINAEVLAGGKVHGPWLEEVVGAIRTAVVKEFGNPSLFGDELTTAPAPAAAPTTPAPAPAAATAPAPPAPPPAVQPQASAPAVTRTPATPPAAPTPSSAAAAPAAVLPLPDDGRGRVREGAGLVETALAALGGRPCTIALIPGASGVVFTLTPRIAKAGESALLVSAPNAAELDAKLQAAIDSHFK